MRAGMGCTKPAALCPASNTSCEDGTARHLWQTAGHVGKVVEATATALLERPDFLTVQDLARKYEHVVPLRVLSTSRQHFRWKEFILTPECFEDHSIESYVNKLFDAFDSSRPECHIHHQTS